MSTFTVSPDSLNALAGHLEGLGQQMLSLQQLPSGDATSLGGSNVAAAVEDFSGHWKHGVDLLDKAVADLSKNLRAAATAYAKTETAIEQAAAKDDRVVTKMYTADRNLEQTIESAVRQEAGQPKHAAPHKHTEPPKHTAPHTHTPPKHTAPVHHPAHGGSGRGTETVTIDGDGNVITTTSVSTGPDSGRETVTID